MRALFVGEDNPHSSVPAMALYPAPNGCAGWRLCHLVLGLTDEEYLAEYGRVNLCQDEWDEGIARHEAMRLAHRAGAEGVTLVLLGAKVARAFGFKYEPFTVHHGGAEPVVILPHPSGRSRAWNEPGAYERARRTLASVGAMFGRF